jgi:hypothetical protein
MSTMTHARPTVKPSRPFGLGILEPEARELPGSARFVRIDGVYESGLYERCDDFDVTGVREWRLRFDGRRVRQLDHFVRRWHAEGMVEVVGPDEVAAIDLAVDHAYAAGLAIALDEVDQAEAPRSLSAPQRWGWSLGYDAGLKMLAARQEAYLAEMAEEAEWSDAFRMECVGY